jgi:hypothetical protein
MGTLTEKAPWFLWPLTIVWDLATSILVLVGRILCAALGFALMAVGVLVTMTIVGAWVGVPLATLGALLMVRAIF